MYWIIWYDDSRKSAAEKIIAGCRAYQERYNVVPTHALVNEIDMAVVPNVRIEPRATVRPNSFWIGLGDTAL